MANPEPTRRKPLASEVAAFSDTELDRFLEESRLKCGVTVVEVQDPKNLPESFIQRLRDRAQCSPSGIAHSRAVDLDQVNARLLAFADNCNTSPSRSPRSFALTQCDEESTRSPTPPQVHATTYYNKLVLDGGRPLYPIQLVDVISKSPRDYRDLLQPWQDHPNNDVPTWQVFWHQWACWRVFRRWQVQNRTVEYPHHPDTDGRSAFGTFVTNFRRHGIMSYEAGLEELFVRYNVTRHVTKPYQIHQDPDRQDKLTTWIEYLAYSCASLCMLELRLEQEKPAYDAAWQSLLDKGVVKASDTKKLVFTTETAFQRQRERDQAWLAVQSARDALLSAQQNEAPEHHSICAVQSELDAAMETLDSLDKRSHYIGVFFTNSRRYLNIETTLACENNKLQWVVEQIPLIEAEMKDHRVIMSSNTTRGVKRNHEEDSTDTISREPLKRQKKSTNQSVSSTDDGSVLNPSHTIAENHFNSLVQHASSPAQPGCKGHAQASPSDSRDEVGNGVDSHIRKKGPPRGRAASLSKGARSLDQSRYKIKRRWSRPMVDTAGLRRSARIRARRNPPGAAMSST